MTYEGKFRNIVLAKFGLYYAIWLSHLSPPERHNEQMATSGLLFPWQREAALA